MVTIPPQEVVLRYFELSNRSDLSAISEMFAETTTYNSQNTGTYLGQTAIMSMQKAFHKGFDSLHWTINSIHESEPGVVSVDFDFVGMKTDGSTVVSAGVEDVVVVEDFIQRIDIRNHPSP